MIFEGFYLKFSIFERFQKRLEGKDKFQNFKLKPETHPQDAHSDIV